VQRLCFSNHQHQSFCRLWCLWECGRRPRTKSFRRPDRESQVRTRLTAGGSQIRTISSGTRPACSPSLNGLEVARLARLSRPGLPILFVTGFANTSPADRSGSAGRGLRSPTARLPLGQPRRLLLLRVGSRARQNLLRPPSPSSSGSPRRRLLNQALTPPPKSCVQHSPSTALGLPRREDPQLGMDAVKLDAPPPQRCLDCGRGGLCLRI
jgi:hypothetical protein